MPQTTEAMPVPGISLLVPRATSNCHLSTITHHLTTTISPSTVHRKLISTLPTPKNVPCLHSDQGRSAFFLLPHDPFQRYPLLALCGNTGASVIERAKKAQLPRIKNVVQAVEHVRHTVKKSVGAGLLWIPHRMQCMCVSSNTKRLAGKVSEGNICFIY